MFAVNSNHLSDAYVRFFYTFTQKENRYYKILIKNYIIQLHQNHSSKAAALFRKALPGRSSRYTAVVVLPLSS